MNARERYKLFEIFRGAELPSSTAASLGQSAGSRGMLLATLVNQGKVPAKDLSAQDAQAAAANMDKVHPGESKLGSIFGGVGGFLGNLGGDVWSATKGLAPGVWHAAKAVAYDATHPFTTWGGFGGDVGGSSHIAKDIIKPQEDYFKQQYGQGNVFENFYNHPLGPILDLATVASLGAGGVGRAGAGLSRAGKISSESRLARIGSTEGRSPLVIDKSLPDEMGTLPQELPRDYSSRPLKKGLQVLTDKLGEHISPIQKGQIWSTSTFGLKKGASIKDSEALQRINRQVQQLIPVFKALDPEEQVAFDNIVRGINSPEALLALRETRKASRKNELDPALGANAVDYGRKIKPEVPESRIAQNDRADVLSVDPSQSDRLFTALQSYYNVVNERITKDLDPEIASKKANEVRDSLTEMWGDIGHAPEGHPFPHPTIAPSQEARRFEWHEPGRLGQIFGHEPGWKKVQGPFTPSNVTYQNVLQEPFNTYRPKPAPVLAGVHRPDMRQFVDLIAKHERDVVEQAYSAKLLNQWALKDEHGEPVKVKSVQEAEKYGDQYTAVHPSAPLQYYSDQTTVADMVSFMEERGFPVDGPEMRAAIEAVGEDTAMKMTQAAKRQDAYVLPKSVVEYQRKIENASKPYENAVVRKGAKYLNYWRTYTLSLMPRWALNTAVGSFMLNNIKGVNPLDYRRAMALNKDIAGTRGEGIFTTPEAGGVNLGNQIGMELLEPALQGGLSGTNRIARQSMRAVQGIEDYFRRASFVHSLDRAAKQHLRESGTTIINFEKSKGPRTIDEYRDLILQNPKLVQQALDDVNRFAYNFAMLGPFERRVVRQIAPFWGWYKFISGVVYKLPVEYPGRANLLSQIGAIGMAENEKAGPMPRWLMGNIPLSIGGGMMKYLSTTGLNPFSQVFNPGSPEGVAGFAQIGQASPLIQAALAAYGVDPISGGSLPVSPEHGVSPDFTGTLRDEQTGEERSVGSVDPLGRVLGTLIRSFPEARIGERMRAGGRGVYPESIPLISEYYMPTKPESRYGSGIMEALAQMTGTAVRPFNLDSYQRQRVMGLRYARRRGLRSRMKLKDQLK